MIQAQRLLQPPKHLPRVRKTYSRRIKLVQGASRPNGSGRFCLLNLYSPFPLFHSFQKRHETRFIHFQSLIALFSAIISVSACGGDHPPSYHKTSNQFRKEISHSNVPFRTCIRCPTSSFHLTDLHNNKLPVIATYTPESLPPLSGAPLPPACK